MERFEFQYSAATAPPPTGAQIRTDGDQLPTVTKMWTRGVTTPGEDVYRLLSVMPAGTILWLQDYDDHTRYEKYVLSEPPVEIADYHELRVEGIEHGGALGVGHRHAVVEDAGDGGGGDPGRRAHVGDLHAPLPDALADGGDRSRAHEPGSGSGSVGWSGRLRGRSRAARCARHLRSSQSQLPVAHGPSPA